LVAELKKKKECKKKALNIVVELIDGELEEDVLLHKLRSINACHYEDVVEERFILKQCGYPMCSQHLTNIPTKKYSISSTYNKVYDITERKKFCSDLCYKSSKYLHCQLLTSPLWLRDLETIPKFKLFKASSEKNENVKQTLKSNKFDEEKKCNEIRSNEKLEEKLSELKL